jgi:leucyl aminopeptidase
MAATSTTTPIATSAAPLPTLDTDVLAVPWFEGERAAENPTLDAATGGEIARGLASGEYAARPYELFLAPIVDRAYHARRVALIGAGTPAEFGSDLLRRTATFAALSLRQRSVAHAAFLLPIRGRDAEVIAGFAQAAAEGLTLAEFNVGSYKTTEPAPGALTTWTIVVDQRPGDVLRHAQDAISRGRLLGECSNLARELANEPGNTLTPKEFARRCERIATEGGASVEVLDEEQIKKLGMGLLLGVARGSSEPPRLMVFRHEPPAAPASPVLGLVGKGITFDTGGISIKPADGMERMKDDMSGGAAVACAIRAISMLKAPIRVVGIVPATENMPGGRAIKPGDILRSASGKTVEVINTDAEGRLILGDGLWYARQLGATHLVDVATLTGACVVALGKITSGLFGAPMEWVEQVRRVADREGDRSWPMPLFDEYRDQLKSDIADLMNTGGRPAASITAAIFLKEFTGGLPWVHMDVAGTAWLDEAKPYMPKGPSGVAVRTLAELPFTYGEWK